ncbi:MAG: flavin monoamine oxidase family protein [Candidatus Sericytochromatia bacterium]
MPLTLHWSRLPVLIVWLSLLLSGCNPAQTESEGPPPSEKSQAPAAQSPETETEVLIVGGGLSGLSTAYQLKKAGIRYRILELAPRVGGRVRTGQYPEKVSAEVGLAEFWDGNPALDIAQALKVPMERVDTSFSSFLLDGHIQAFTQDSNAAFLKATLGADYPAYQAWDAEMGKLIHALEAGPPSAELLKLKDVAFADWLTQQKLPAKGQALVKAVLEPEIGTSLKRIGALDGIAEWHLFTGKGLSPNHVVGGNQNFTEALADHVGREHISLNTQVTNVIDTPEGVEVRAMDTATFRNRTFKARYAVLAIPLYRLFEIQFVPRLSQDIYQAVHTQSWGAYFTAHVQLDKAAEKYWTQAGSNVLPILSGGPLGVIYPGNAEADAEEVLLNLLITGDHAEAFNSRALSLDDVQQQLEAAFEKTFPGIGPLIRKWTFYRYHPRAIASWPVGRSRFDALSNGLRKAHGHLYFGGDFTESSHSDGAVVAALRVSQQITAAFKK